MKKHNSEPFWRESKQTWYCWIDGRQRSLGKKKRAAQDRYRQLVAERDRLSDRKPWTVRQCFDYYLEYAESFPGDGHKKRKRLLNAFATEAKVGSLPHSELTADHLEAWVKTKAWSASMGRTAMNYVTSAMNYCAKRGKIPATPLKNVQKPRWERRKVVISADDERAVYEASKGTFRDILTVLRLGARPSELCRARAQDYRDGMIVLSEHKTDESGDDRTIYLTGEARAVVERLVGNREPGQAIFLNSRGEPWTPDTIYCRFKRLRKKLGLGEGVFPYSLRHKFTSDAINDGNANPALVAKALGHADLNMLLKHYLRENPDAVKKMLDELGNK
jgi:integrase/recombinase XerC